MNNINVRDPAGKCASDSPGPIEHGGTIASTNDLDRSNSLADLAARIRAEHEGMTAAMRRGVEHAIRAGDLLIEAKAKVPHGQWLPWLAEHVALPERTARLYMRLASNRAAIEQNGNVADLSINRALKLLTAPPPKAAPPWDGVRIDVEKGMREELAALVELASPHGQWRHEPEPPPQVEYADAVAATRLAHWRARQSAASALASKRSAAVLADELVQEVGLDLATKVAQAVDRQARLARDKRHRDLAAS